LARNVSGPDAFIGEPADGIWSDARLASFVDAPCLSGFDTPRLALPSQIRSKLREHAEHIEKSLARRSARIDRLLGSFQRYAPFLQFVDDIL
jgi:hypothetical protein